MFQFNSIVGLLAFCSALNLAGMIKPLVPSPWILAIVTGGLSPKQKGVARIQLEKEKKAKKRDEAAFLLILSPKERKEYRRLQSAEERAQWQHIFWKKRDPTPTTEKNERKEEHERRVKFARQFYPAFTPQGFDDRGVIYVKYGAPEDKYTQPVGNLFAKGNESWAYPSLGGLVFDFVEFGHGYYLVRDLSEAIGLAGGKEDPRLLFVLYNDRRYLDPKYSRVASELEMGMGRQALDRLVMEKEVAFSKAPPEVYHYDYRTKHLPFVFRLANFREDQDKSRVELYYGVSFNELKFALAGDSLYHTTLSPAVVVYNNLYQKIASDSSNLAIKLPSKTKVQDKYFVDQADLSLAPGEYHLALQIGNPEGNKLGICTTDLMVQDFSTKSLAVSDIEFASTIREVAVADKFVKNGLQVIPYPGYAIPRSGPIFIYYEIYNLKKDAFGNTSYQVEYTAKTVKKKKGLASAVVSKVAGFFKEEKKESITISYKRQGNSETQVEYILLDLRELRLGESKLVVTIKDLNVHTQARSITTFKLVK